MAETLTANLALNLNEFTNALAQASQQIQAFAANVAQQIQSANAAFQSLSTPMRQLMNLQTEMMQMTVRNATATTQANQQILASEQATTTSLVEIKRYGAARARDITRQSADHAKEVTRETQDVIIRTEGISLAERTRLRREAEDKATSIRRSGADTAIAITQQATNKINAIRDQDKERHALVKQRMAEIDERKAKERAAFEEAANKRIAEAGERIKQRIEKDQQEITDAIRRGKLAQERFEEAFAGKMSKVREQQRQEMEKQKKAEQELSDQKNALRMSDDRLARGYQEDQLKMAKQQNAEQIAATKVVAEEKKRILENDNRLARQYAEDQKALAREESKVKREESVRVAEAKRQQEQLAEQAARTQQNQRDAESALLRAQSYRTTAQQSIETMRSASQQISALIKSGSSRDSAEVQQYSAIAKSAHLDAATAILRAQTDIRTAIRLGNEATVASAQRLKVETQDTASQASQAFRDIGRSVEGTQVPISRMGALIQSAFAYATGSIFASIVSGIVGGIKNMVTSSVELAIKMQSLNAAFAAVAGGSVGATSTLAFLRNEAQRIGVSFLPVAESFKGFAAAIRGTSLEGEKGRAVFTAFTEAGRVLGLSGDQTKHIFIALEQMMNKGKVSAEELRRQMSNFLPGAFEIAARAIGVTTSELDAMLKKGELLSEVFIPAFARQVRQELGPGLKAASDTAAASFARLGNDVKEVAVEVGNAILQILKPIADFVDYTYQKVKGMSETQNTAAGIIMKAGFDIGPAEFDKTTGKKSIDVSKLTPVQIYDMVKLQENMQGSFLGMQFPTDPLAEKRLKILLEQIRQQQIINAEKDKEQQLTNRITTSQEQLTKATKDTADILEKLQILRRDLAPSANTMEVPEQFKNIIAQASQSFQVPEDLLMKLINVETGGTFNPNATSPKGAVGLTQIMEETGRQPGYGVSQISPRDRTDPFKNVNFGAEYLAAMFREMGKITQDATERWKLALTAFNAGPGTMQETFSKAKTRGLPMTLDAIRPLLPTLEAQTYAGKVLGDGSDFGELFGANKREEVEAYLEQLEKLRALLKNTPALYSALSVAQKQSIELAIQEGVAIKAQLALEEERGPAARRTIADLRQKGEAAERNAEQRRRMLAQAQLRTGSADDPIEQINRQFDELNARLVEAGDIGTDVAKAELLRKVAVAQAEVELQRDATDQIMKLRKKHTQELIQIEDFLTKEEAKTSGKRVDIVKNEFEERAKNLKKLLGAASGEEIARIELAIQRNTKAEIASLEQAATKDLEEELRKQKAAYKELASGIEGIFRGVFEGLLSGTLDTFSAIKRFFIKLLADLAAQAATGIAINFVTGIAGGAAGAGASGLVNGVLGTVVGSATGAGGGDGGSSTAGTVVSTGVTAVGAGNTLSGLFGGSGKGIVSNLFGKVLNTPIKGAFGGSSQTVGTAGLFGPEGGVGLESSENLAGSFGAETTFGDLLGPAGAGITSGLLLSQFASYLGANKTTSRGVGVAGGLGGAYAAYAVPSAGPAIAAVGAGVGAGLLLDKINHLIGITGRASGALAGAGGGAAAGALAGTFVFPGVGTGIGALIGTIVGAIGGGLLSGGKKTPLFDPRGVTAGRVGYDDTLGLQLQERFRTEDVGYRRLGLKTKDVITGATTSGRDIADQMDAAVNEMFTSFLEGFKLLPPAFQKHLVNPINDIAAQIGVTIEKARFEGNDWPDQLKKFLSEDLPESFKRLVTPIQDALKKMDPVIQKFTEIVETIGQEILELEQAKIEMRGRIGTAILGLKASLSSQRELLAFNTLELQAMRAMFDEGTAQQQLLLAPKIADASLQILEQFKQIQETAHQTFLQIKGSMESIRTALFSPAQLYLEQRKKLTELQGEFAGGTEQERQALGPQIAEIANQIMQSAKSEEVLGQDPQALRNLQQELLGIIDGLGFKDIDKNAVRNFQGQLVEQLVHVQAGTDAAYTSFQDVLQKQVDLASEQLNILLASLSNLSSVDEAVKNASAVLNGIQDSIGGAATSGDAILQAQVALLGGLSNIGTDQLNELRVISAKIGSASSFSGGNLDNIGSSSGESFAEGTAYVPKTGMALIHEGEAIIPRHIAAQMRSIGAFFQSYGSSPVIVSSFEHISSMANQAAKTLNGTYAWMNGGGRVAANVAQSQESNTDRLVVQIEAAPNTPSSDVLLEKLTQRVIEKVDRQISRHDKHIFVSRR